MVNESLSAKAAPFLLFASALCWSLAGIFTKSIPWSGVTLASARGAVAFFICIAVLGRIKIKITRSKLLIAFCYFAQGLLFITANKLTTAANATVLQNMSPLYIIVLNAIILKSKPSRLEIGTCVFLLIGIACAFIGNMESGGAAGNICALASALFYAGVFFFSKAPDADSLESLVLGNLLYILILPFCLAQPHVFDATTKQWIMVVAFSVITGGVAWLSFSQGIKHTSAIQANFITMTEPIMAPIWAFLLLRESVSALSFVGCALVIGTLIVYNTLVSRLVR